MNLTKQERNEAYKNALKEAESAKLSGNNLFCCCSSFQKFFAAKLFDTSIWDFLSQSRNNFPELYNQKTTNYLSVGSYWFKNNSERIEALNKCIELTKP